MVSAAVFTSLALLAFASAQDLDGLIEFSSPVSITPADPVKAHFLQPGFINGVKDCGGSGRTLQITHTNCVPALPAVTCIAELEKESSGYVYFVAGEDADEVLVRAIVKMTDGQTKSTEIPVPGTSLRAGRSYVLRATGKGESNLLGKVFTARTEVVRTSDKKVQACSEVDFVGIKL